MAMAMARENGVRFICRMGLGQYRNLELPDGINLTLFFGKDKSAPVGSGAAWDFWADFERVTGIEPASSAWEAEALPLDDTR
jgi:hypothetical protein